MNNQPMWLIEANVEGLPTETWKSEIQRQGMNALIVKPFLHSPFPTDILGAESIPLDASVVFTGTLSLMRYLQTNRRWRPGGWCNFDNLCCSKYYSYFGPYLLNRRYAIYPVAEALRLKTWLFETFGKADQVFVRPDSADKSFTGNVIAAEDFDDLLSSKLRDPSRLVLVAEPQDIIHEWRLFVGHGEIITGCRYRFNRNFLTTPAVPDSVSQFVTQVLGKVKWRPDPLFVMDIAETQTGLHIVELNSFSCSGLLAANLESYVSAASQLASLA